MILAVLALEVKANAGSKQFGNPDYLTQNHKQFDPLPPHPPPKCFMLVVIRAIKAESVLSPNYNCC